MNGRTFSQNPRKAGKIHHLHTKHSATEISQHSMYFPHLSHSMQAIHSSSSKKKTTTLFIHRNNRKIIFRVSHNGSRLQHIFAKLGTNLKPT